MLVVVLLVTCLKMTTNKPKIKCNDFKNDAELIDYYDKWAESYDKVSFVARLSSKSVLHQHTLHIKPIARKVDNFLARSTSSSIPILFFFYIKCWSNSILEVIDRLPAGQMDTAYITSRLNQ